MQIDKDFYNKYGIYVKPIDYPMSQRKVDRYKEIAYMQKYFQCNPVRFIDTFFNIELLDCQALALQQMWTKQNILIVASRGLGKSTIVDLFTMSKGMLFNNYWTYLASGSGDQAKQTFSVLEKIANDNIDTFAGSTGKLFKDELVVANAAGGGFVHGSGGYSYQLNNGSSLLTLNSNVDRRRGLRGNVIFDESGFLSDEMMNVYAAFAIVNKSLKTGKDEQGNSIDPIRQRTFATDIPNQKIYVSSASSTDTHFYRLYREFSKKMIMGDKDYAVLHLDCEIAFKPTLHGETIAPLLSRSIVESEMRVNPEKARREYYCEFTTDAGTDAIIRRGVITRNEETRKPLLYNDTGDKKFILAYDPARSRDNSVILIMEVYQDEDDGERKGRIVNVVNLMDVGKKIKSPMRTPEQIEYLKELIVLYNAGADAYGNIEAIYIDAGSGGGGVNIADFLMPDWTDKAGTTHRGLIDREYSSEYVKRFPNAVDKVRLMSPAKYKSTMFEALIELLNQDKISFTAPYDNKGYLTVLSTDDKRLKRERGRIMKRLDKLGLDDEAYEKKLQEELDKLPTDTDIVKLDWKDEIALTNIDALKEELVNFVRKKRDSGNDSFDLTPEKEKILHDDRAYTLAMAGYGLSEVRRRERLSKVKKPTASLADKLTIRAFKRNRDF